MKLIKFGISAIIVILILNYFGLLNPIFGKKVDDASKVALAKAKEEWSNTPLAKTPANDLVNSIASMSLPVNFKSTASGVYSINGTNLSGTLNNNEPKSVELTFNPTADSSTVNQAEGILSLYMGKKVSISQDKIKNLTSVKVKVSNKDGNYSVASNVANLIN